MSIVHPLWSDPPNEENFAKGLTMIEKAKVKGTKTKRELAYIKAIDNYYAQGRKEKETDNLVAFEQGWAKVHDAFPSDPKQQPSMHCRCWVPHRQQIKAM